jgi:hypothetical protein
MPDPLMRVLLEGSVFLALLEEKHICNNI